MAPGPWMGRVAPARGGDSSQQQQSWELVAKGGSQAPPRAGPASCLLTGPSWPAWSVGTSTWRLQAGQFCPGRRDRFTAWVSAAAQLSRCCPPAQPGAEVPSQLDPGTRPASCGRAGVPGAVGSGTEGCAPCILLAVQWAPRSPLWRAELTTRPAVAALWPRLLPPGPRPPRPDFTVAAAGQTPPTSSALSSCLTLGRGLGGRHPARPSCAACSLLPPREGGLCPRPAVQPALVRPPWARSSDLCRSSAGSQRAVGAGGALALPGPSPAAVGARSPGPPCSHAALLCPQGGRAEGGHSHDQDGPEEARDVRKPV